MSRAAISPRFPRFDPDSKHSKRRKGRRSRSAIHFDRTTRSSCWQCEKKIKRLELRQSERQNPSPFNGSKRLYSNDLRPKGLAARSAVVAGNEWGSAIGRSCPACGSAIGSACAINDGRCYGARDPIFSLFTRRRPIVMIRAVEDARNLPSEHRKNGLRLALSARYAANKGWIHSELARYAAVKPAKE